MIVLAEYENNILKRENGKAFAIAKVGSEAFSFVNNKNIF